MKRSARKEKMKMYRRNNLPKAKPRTKKSEKNRYRNVIMNFRVTTEEKENKAE